MYLSSNKVKDRELELIKKKINKNPNLNFILLSNPYEKIIPYNLWFYHNDYNVADLYQNNQHLRCRYYDGQLLTPIISLSDMSDNIFDLLDNMPIYHPYYPESYFPCWEFLQLGHITNFNSCLYIGRETGLGNIESLIMYMERIKQNSYNIKYDCWYIENEVLKVDRTYDLCEPKINYLNQTYNIKFLHSTKDLQSYDLIILDLNHALDNLVTWNNEELDLQATLYYLFYSFSLLENEKSLLIKLNMLCHNSWSVVFNVLNKVFKEYVFYRPQITNPYNPEILLYLHLFKKKKLSFKSQLLMNLYKKEIFKFYYINCTSNTDNSMFHKFSEEKKKWNSQLNKIVKMKPTNIKNWYQINDLKKIGDLKCEFNNDFLNLPLEKNNGDLNLKLNNDCELSTNKKYIYLLKKKISLNYHKRMMDTKPNKMFLTEYSYHDDIHLTWDELTNRLDIYREIKKEFKNRHIKRCTNAWLKMFEILNHLKGYNIFPDTHKKTFHLCESPGAFISAFEYFFKDKLEWYAQSLLTTEKYKPLDDQYGLYELYPDRWLFGDKNGDFSGDITHSNIIKYYASHEKLKNVDFITADAGIKCNPIDINNQEIVMMKIIMGEIIAILACLPKTKSGIVKMFLPMSEPLTISLIYLISHLFEKIEFIKPMTSHAYNSEIYILMINYKGIDSKLLDLLYILLDDDKITSASYLFSNFNYQFTKNYTSILSLLIDKQINSLCTYYYYYYHPDKYDDFFNNSKLEIETWLKNNNVINF